MSIYHANDAQKAISRLQKSITSVIERSFIWCDWQWDRYYIPKYTQPCIYVTEISTLFTLKADPLYGSSFGQKFSLTFDHVIQVDRTKSSYMNSLYAKFVNDLEKV